MLRTRFVLVLAAVAITSLVSAGCRQASGHGDDEPQHGHDDAEEAIQRTVWHGNYEVFYEYDAARPSVPVSFHVHVSDLTTGLPRTSGRATLIAEGPEGARAEASGDAPIRPGIYSLELRLDRPGAWRARLALGEAADAALIPLPDIVVAAEHGTPDDAPRGITVLKEQQWALRLLTSAASTERVARHVHVPADVVAGPGRVASVVAPVEGALLPPDEGAFPALGDRVKEGAILARIEPPLSGADFLAVILHHHELQVLEAELSVKHSKARADLSRDTAARGLAARALERTRALAAVKARSESELADAEFEAAAAASTAEATSAIQAVYTEALEELHSHPVHDANLLERFPAFEVRAPIAGVVDVVRATHGEHVESQREIAAIVDTSEVHVVAHVAEGLVAALGERPEAFVALRGGDEIPLELVHVGLALREARALPVTFRASNGDGRLRLGMAMEVAVRSGPRKECVAVPDGAIVDESGADVAFVQLAGETFEKRYVTIGGRERGLVEIVEGVGLGERVVTRGASVVRAVALGGGGPVEHEH